MQKNTEEFKNVYRCIEKRGKKRKTMNKRKNAKKRKKRKKRDTSRRARTARTIVQKFKAINRIVQF